MLDVGCGLGVLTVLLAEAFPNSTFVGVDYHEESIHQATSAAEEAGVADRVQFHVADATSYNGSYDLALFFDAVHDFGDPVAALGHARSVLPGWQGRRRRAVRRGHPGGQPGQPDSRGVLRRQLGPCVPHSSSRAAPHSAPRPVPPGSPRRSRTSGFSTADVAITTAYNLVIQARA